MQADDSKERSEKRREVGKNQRCGIEIQPKNCQDLVKFGVNKNNSERQHVQQSQKMSRWDQLPLPVPSTKMPSSVQIKITTTTTTTKELNLFQE